MVPLLTRRSILVLSIGLVLGIVLGLGYWAISPVQVWFDGGWMPIKIAGLTAPRSVLYETMLLVDVKGLWSQGAEREKLETFGEYSDSVLESSLFMTWLSDELVQARPEYRRTPEELQQMVKVSYRYDTHLVRVLVTSHDPRESGVIADLIAGIFPSFMTEQADTMFSEQYQNTLAKIDKISVDLAETRKQMAAFAPESNITDGNVALNPSYIVLDAKAATLTGRLRELSLAQMLLDSDSSEYYDITRKINDVSLELVDIRKQMDALSPGTDTQAFKMAPAYMTLTAKESALGRQREDLIRSLSSLTGAYLEELDLVGSLAPGSPAAPVPLPPDRMQGRYAAVMGALVGLFGAWVVLNFKALVAQVRSSSLVSATEQLSEEKDEEE